MAVTEVNSVMKFKDTDGDITVIYPVTKTNAVVTTGDGSAYEATVKGISELTIGASFVMIPHVTCTIAEPTLNVNGLGAAPIRRRSSMNTGITFTTDVEAWLSINQPIEVMYNGSVWVADLPQPVAEDLWGQVPVRNGGTGASDAGTARSNLGLGSVATLDTVPIAQGGTGAVTAEDALSSLGAVPLSGGTMTGTLTAPDIYLDRGSGSDSRLNFQQDGTQIGLIYVRTDDSNFVFKQTLNGATERFWLPKVTNTSESEGKYDILTTKTVTYGTDDPETAVGAAGTAGRIYYKKVSS